MTGKRRTYAQLAKPVLFGSQRDWYRTEFLNTSHHPRAIVGLDLGVNDLQ